MVNTDSWLRDYSTTLIHWLLVGAAVIGVILLTYFVLRKFGVRAEPATGYALIMPWLLGFLIFILFPFVTSFYLSFTGQTNGFQQLLPRVREGLRRWETTPYSTSMMIWYSNAHTQRIANGSCYLGKSCM